MRWPPGCVHRARRFIDCSIPKTRRSLSPRLIAPLGRSVARSKLNWCRLKITSNATKGLMHVRIISGLRSINSRIWDQEFPGGGVYQGLQRSLVDWFECRFLLSLARQESCQCSTRHKSDGNDFGVGFHIKRNYSLITPRCSRKAQLQELIIPDEIHHLLR